MAEYLVSGYVRREGKAVSFSIIPLDIVSEIFQFYYCHNLLYFTNCLKIPKDEDDEKDEAQDAEYIEEKIHSMEILDFDSNRNWSYIIDDDINNNKQNIFTNNSIATNHISLPSKITKSISRNVNQHQSYNAIFTIGGGNSTDDKCTAMIINETEMFKKKEHSLSEMSYWSLPDLPQSIYANSVIYSDRYGLFSIGGKDRVNNYYYNAGKIRNVYNLNLNGIELGANNWKWEEYKPLLGPSSDSAAAMIDGDTKLINIDQNVRMYSFDKNEWIQVNPCKDSTYGPGICYEQFTERIYITGWRKKFSYFDINKNVWYVLPKTTKDHGYKPLVWKLNRYLLYIASMKADCVEFIDVRMDKFGVNKMNWKCIHAMKKNKLRTILNCSRLGNLVC